jgi:phage-related protein
MTKGFEKPLFWVASSRKDLMTMPADVQDTMGYALYLAQTGSKHSHCKPLKGFGHAGVLEVVEDFHGNTYRGLHIAFRRRGVCAALFPEKIDKKYQDAASRHCSH